MPTEKQIASLPRWAQHIVTSLEDEVKSLRQKLADKHPNSRVAHNDLGSVAPVSDRGSYRFFLGKGALDVNNSIDVRLRDGRLGLVAHDGRLLIIPHASNVVHAEVRNDA